MAQQTQGQGLFAAIRTALNGATGELASIRGQLEKLRQRREFLAVAPLPRADVENAILARVDRLAADYPRQLGRYLASAGVGTTRHEKLGRLADFVRPLHLVAASGTTNSTTAAQFSEAALCYLLGDTMKARLQAALGEADLDWPAEVGPPAAQRTAELQTLEQQIAALEGEERELLAQLRAAIAIDSTRGTPADEFAGGVPTTRTGKAEL